MKGDRRDLEKKLLKFAGKNKNNEYGIWISTQIVEASLDVDFDILFTDMCSIDSLFQRMGRVYRNREYSGDMPNIHIYNNRNGVPYVIDPDIYRYTLNEIIQYDNKKLSEEDKQRMIENIFDKSKNGELISSKYYKEIIRKIDLMEHVIPNENNFSEISDAFRNIQSILLIPENIYKKLYQDGKIKEWSEEFKGKITIKRKMEIINDIEIYTVSVAWRKYLEYDKEELFYKNSNIYRTKYNYDFDKEKMSGKGLIIEKSTKQSYFDE
jgi:CRISPR-associated endonuclease/helicase Cas3